MKTRPIKVLNITRIRCENESKTLVELFVWFENFVAFKNNFAVDDTFLTSAALKKILKADFVHELLVELEVTPEQFEQIGVQANSHTLALKVEAGQIKNLEDSLLVLIKQMNAE